MFEAETLEFPFAEALPKREKSRLVRCWDLVKRMNEISETEGDLVPLMLAARCLGLSRSRVDDLVREGRLKRFEIDNHVFLSQNSIIEFAKLERKNGRPPKIPNTREMWKMATDSARESLQKKS